MLENVINSLINDQVGKLAEKNGIDPVLAKSIASKVLPTIIWSIGKNTEDTSSAEKLLAAASEHNEETIDDVDTTDGMKILWHLFGDKKATVTNQVATDTWASTEDTDKIMSTLAPLVMAYINKQQQSWQVDATNINKQISETSSIWDKDGVVMKMATAMLDENKDWSITDDLLKKWMDMFFNDKKAE